MSENSISGDPRSLWREQPAEKTPVLLEHFLKLRTRDLSTSTRFEILHSLAAALFFVAVLAWRLSPVNDRLVQLSLVLTAAWIPLTLYWFRRRIWPRPGPPV